MSKLNSKDRNALSTEDFGLPKDRKYPLIDEEHVRKAVQFFKFCPTNKRNELALNINRRAKQLGMTIKVSPENPFYRYMNKQQAVNESSTEVAYEFERLMDLNTHELTAIIDELQAQLNINITNLFNELFSDASIQGIISLEEKMINQILSEDKFLRVYKQIQAREHSINPIRHINMAFDMAYSIIFEYLEYNTDYNLTTTREFYKIFDDIFFYLDRTIHDNPNIEDVKKKLKLIEDFSNQFSCNFYFILRKLKELQIGVMIYMFEAMDGPITEDEPDRNKPRVMKLEDIYILITNFLNKCVANTVKTVVVSPFLNRDQVVEYLHSADMNMTNLSNYLNNLGADIKNQIDTILMSSHMSLGGHHLSDEVSFFLAIDPQKDWEIYSNITYLDGTIREENVRKYNADYTMKLDSEDIMVMTNLKQFSRLYVGKDRNGDPVYYGTSPGKLYLLLKNRNVVGEYFLLKIYDGRQAISEINLTCDPVAFDPLSRAKAIRINMRPDQDRNDMELVTEGLFINEKGDLKFRFKPKKSYMDEYAENHKILVANSKAKNYEAMKVNLAFLFSLINTVEREVIHGKKGKKYSQDQIKDAEKARMFATNDFKTYMKEVQRAEPSFDFTSYYENSDYGKVTINVGSDEIVGLKKLFRIIMFS